MTSNTIGAEARVRCPASSQSMSSSLEDQPSTDKASRAKMHNKFGTLFQQKGQFEKAVVQYRRAVVLKPDYAHAHFNLGTSLGNLADRAGAIRHLKLALRHKDGFAEAHANLASQLLQLSVEAGDEAESEEAPVAEEDTRVREAHDHCVAALSWLRRCARVACDSAEGRH